MKTIACCAILAVFTLACQRVEADEHHVKPGPGALAAGLAKAKSGDVVRLAAGEYAESVTIDAGITIDGAGAEKTIIVSKEYAVLNCRGPEVRIVGLTIRGKKGNVRGIDASDSVRIERCRFEKLNEAIALMAAPLSDVVACEFVECGIGVRAIGGASPTVWGCAFKGGNIGVFGMNGSPYIRNNLFDGVKTGIKSAPGDSDGGIIRNNVFFGCETAAIELFETKPAFGAPSIRNSIMIRCGAAVLAPANLASSVTHAVVHEVKGPPFRDSEGTVTRKIGENGLSEHELTVNVGKDFTVKSEPADALQDRGVRLWSEKEGTTGTIGLERAWSRVGTGATADLPPQRFGGERLIANSVSEEYLYVRSIGRRSVGQGLNHEKGVPVDRLKFDDGKKPGEIAFDLSRFFGEAFIK